jgi:hypothetical protein
MKGRYCHRFSFAGARAGKWDMGPPVNVTSFLFRLTQAEDIGG